MSGQGVSDLAYESQPSSLGPDQGKQSPASDRKRTQRERILAGAIEVVAREGYAAATVAQIIAHAGVSRPTFYDYFEDKTACFLAAIEAIHEQLSASVEAALKREEPARATEAAIERLVAFCDSNPAMARVLMNETLAGGPRVLDARDAHIAALAETIEHARRPSPDDVAIADISTLILIGAVYRVLASRMRRGKPAGAELEQGLLTWAKSYEVPSDSLRWSSLEPGPMASATALAHAAPLAPPAQPRATRRRRSRKQAVEDNRLRIIFATGEVAKEKGYTATSIADITRLAGVDHRTFNALFKDKQDAYMAIHDLGFRRIMATTIGAFFSKRKWPERTWAAGQAFTEFLERNPTLAHVGFVESYAVGANAVKRLDDILSAFTIFLQEGYAFSKKDRAGPSRLTLEAIAAAIFELTYRQSREGDRAAFTGLLGHATFIYMAPFVGAAEANSFIDEQLKSDDSER